MLVLTRKLMEKVYIGDEICVTVVRLEGGQVRLGIDAPREIPVIRAELLGSRRRSHMEPAAGPASLPIPAADVPSPDTAGVAPAGPKVMSRPVAALGIGIRRREPSR